MVDYVTLTPPPHLLFLLTRLHNLGQYRVNEEEGVKLRKIGNDLTSMVFDFE